MYTWHCSWLVKLTFIIHEHIAFLTLSRNRGSYCMSEVESWKHTVNLMPVNTCYNGVNRVRTFATDLNVHFMYVVSYLTQRDTEERGSFFGQEGKNPSSTKLGKMISESRSQRSRVAEGNGEHNEKHLQSKQTPSWATARILTVYEEWKRKAGIIKN